MKIIIALALSLVLMGGSCAPRLTGSLCTAGPIRPDPGFAERMTRSEKEQIVTLNESGAVVCGWQP